MPTSEDDQPKPDPKEQQAIFASEYKSKEPFITKVVPLEPPPEPPKPEILPPTPPASDE